MYLICSFYRLPWPPAVWRLSRGHEAGGEETKCESDILDVKESKGHHSRRKHESGVPTTSIGSIFFQEQIKFQQKEIFLPPFMDLLGSRPPPGWPPWAAPASPLRKSKRSFMGLFVKLGAKLFYSLRQACSAGL